MSIIIFILILGILVFVHELGHFGVAKFFGIRVDEFGMGFPPRAIKLFSHKGTDYTLNWIPFGGFVKIYGEDSLEKNDPDYHRSLVSKKWWQQILVLIAGVTMNILLAWILFSASFMMGAPTPASQVKNIERLENPQLTILGVMPNSPAQTAGLLAGDQVIKVVTDSAILSNATQQGFIDFIKSTASDQSVTITINRAGQSQDISVTPELNQELSAPMIGVAIDTVGMYRFGFFGSLWEGLKASYHTTIGTVHAFWNLITGNVSLDALTGPVGLVGVVGDAQKIGFSYLIILTAVISINLAVINMVPFPALDGGRILFIIIEKIIRRPLPTKFVQWANGIGFMLLILLILVVTVKDVIKLF
jgi:regulator of sigma E protease